LLKEARMATPTPQERIAQNRLLRALSPAVHQQLLPALELSALTMRERLIEPAMPIPFVYFPLHGVVSLIRTLGDGTQVEVATIGNEGLIGLSLVLYANTVPFTAFVQVPGEAFRIEAEVFGRLLHEGTGALSQLLYRYTQALFNQLAQHVVCNRLHRIAQRCAHWLLLTHDRVGRDEFPMTHEFLALMLGVRRASVTEVAGRLQKAGLIRYRLGIIRVLDRAGLEAASCECHGVIKQEYDRLLGPA
jgi:CRP-like cAMP-binding protein